ncbi:MAG: hypothetical protein HYU25_01125 [Candidatus Rokubacteria bacterium]|nr:hypothetical protein [Candidatus Rokubacteria bacterium]
MPVTPFHLGPAVIVKAACPRWFSLGVFAIVQAALDVEPTWNIVAGRYPVHGGLHTLPGALLLSAAVIVPARHVVARFFPVSWTAAVTGALVGGGSHVLLDAVIHPDVVPFAPWLAGNALFVPGSFVWMHVGCAAAGLLGGVAWYARQGRAATA